MTPLRVIAFESRRATEMAALVRKQGGVPFVAPSMREVPLADQPEALAFAIALEAGAIDVLICLTGVGTRALVEAVAPRLSRERVAALLAKVAVVARGPKPVAALREIGLVPVLTVPEPNTWRELLAALDAGLPVAGKRVAVQEYGVANPELLAGLADRGATVMRVPVYRWALPEDLAPLREAARRVANADLDVALFTSATQVTHLVQVAAELGVRAALAGGLAAAVVASIGPVCSDALRAAGLPVDLEPSHPKMGPLVTEALRAAPALLSQKRR
jgi:uroporphyrinogen-III synthase